MKMVSITYKLVFIFLCLFNLTCAVKVRPGYIDQDKNNCIRSIDRFHERLNSGRYGDIYADSYIDFQQSLKKEEMIARIKEGHVKTGDFESIIDSAVTLIVGAPVQVRAVYVSKYKNMDVTEAFLFVLDGETFKLAGYQPSEGAQSLKEIKEKLRK